MMADYIRIRVCGMIILVILATAIFAEPHTSYRIVILKARRQLLLFSGDTLIRTYRIGLGLNPVGPKMRATDRRTPEGDYYICVKNPKSAYYLSLGLSYPNEKDAERGLKEGLITAQHRDSILRAIRKKGIPPWNTPLGGEIFIHGRGSGSDWTWGCAALDDPNMKELYDTVPVGTPVHIEP